MNGDLMGMLSLIWLALMVPYYMIYQDGFIDGTHLFLSSGESDKLDSFKSSAAFANNVRESTHKSYMSFAIIPMP